MAASISTAMVAVQVRHREERGLDVASGDQGCVLRGPILGRYLDEGGPTGALGLPVSTERRAMPGPSTPLGADREARFEFGTIYLDSIARRTKVVHFDIGAGASTTARYRACE